jgi:hypothetical protein
MGFGVINAECFDLDKNIALSTLLAWRNTLLTIWASKWLILQTFGERNSSNTVFALNKTLTLSWIRDEI